MSQIIQEEIRRRHVVKKNFFFESCWVFISRCVFHMNAEVRVCMLPYDFLFLVLLYFLFLK